MIEDGTRFGFESCKTPLVTLCCLGVIPEAEAALVGENGQGIAEYTND